MFTWATIISETGSIDYDTTILDPFCFNNGTTVPVTLPCDKKANKRAGILQLKSFPIENCRITVTVDGALCLGSRKYAMYFSIRHFNFELTNSANIYEEETTLVKILPGGDQHFIIGALSHNRQTTYAQLLSNFSRKPTLTLQFNKTSRVPTRPALIMDPVLIIDYVVLGDDFDLTTEVPCPELKCGSMLEKHFLENSSRVNCPLNYTSMIEVDPGMQQPVSYIAALRACHNLQKSPFIPSLTRLNFTNQLNAPRREIATGKNAKLRNEAFSLKAQRRSLIPLCVVVLAQVIGILFR
ncbi:hypothetical protein BV898_17839 [Hypsibius exemplaris]|uniref:Uncharacterized protein n=1 Tax=Hypsibius exemplaris TaxID=2072580 RepID=A0A9X6NGC6_HYPEX|nr:hypothetical protein BV898_17839 [Hypsibius exemplaris]